MKRSLLASLLLSMVGCAAAQAASIPVFSITDPNPSRNSSWGFGEIFTVGSQDISVTALGAYDDDGDGFVTDGGIPVGIFLESNGTLLGSTNVLSGDTLLDGFRYSSISPLILLANTTYRLVAVNLDDNYNVTDGFTINSLIGSVSYAYGETTSLIRLDDYTGSDILWMGNFQAEVAGSSVPEPSTVSSMAAGIALLGYLSRRKWQTRS